MIKCSMIQIAADSGGGYKVAFVHRGHENLTVQMSRSSGASESIDAIDELVSELVAKALQANRSSEADDDDEE